ncbi:MAG: IS1380 family transposase [Bacteroidota bacterium]
MSFSENKITEKTSINQTDQSICQSRLFDLQPIDNKRVEVSFTASDISSDGGLLLVKEIESQIGIIKSVVSCINDTRHQGYIDHSLEEIAAQRVYQIVAGYEDANDCDKLRDDTILKMSVGRLPVTGKPLASQPTMTRFENTPKVSELYNIAYAFVDSFIESYKSEPPVIIIDCDDTNSDTHGAQQLSLFNNYYGEYCYMPLHIYEGLSGKLITTILKPGRRSKGANVFSILKRLIVHLRKMWKNTVIIIRGDSHFCCKELMDWSEDKPGICFITGLTGNSLLHSMIKNLVESCEYQFKRYGKEVKRYHSFNYKAGSWKNQQRVIVKIEVSGKGTNIRFIVTDLWEYRAKALYEQGYCGRGRMELNIKDHKTYMYSGRMSCNRFYANQFRLFLHSAAYVLMHTLQENMLKTKGMASVTMKTLRERFIKIAAQVREMKTKIKVEFPAACAQSECLENYFLEIGQLRC